MLTKRLYVHAHVTGIGNHARGQGNIGLEDAGPDQIKVVVGRTSKAKYSNHSLTSAWAVLSKAKAHELGMALLYMSGGDQFPCKGDGFADGKHSINMEISLTFAADLCTMLSQGEDIKKEVLAHIKQKLDALPIPEKKELAKCMTTETL